MAYRLKTGEPVPEGVRRIVKEEVESATGLLRKESQDRDEAIHDARKSIKKVRGVLRIIRPELGRTFREENAHFRSVGRRLSRLRDAAALLEIFDQLARKFAGELASEDLTAIRRGLEGKKSKIDSHVDTAQVIERAAATLEAAGARAEDWPLEKDGFKVLAAGLKLTYRDGRTALKRAEKHGTDVAFHDMRKRVKDHWYQLRLLEGVWNEQVKDREAKADRLGVLLGDDHNIVVLREALEKRPEHYGGESVTGAFLAVAARDQQALRAEALGLAHELYDGKPRVFVEDLSDLWHKRDEQPERAKKTKRHETRKGASSIPGTKKSRTAAA